jgi:MATE family multidrug resistance protein
MAFALAATWLFEPFGIEHDIALRARDYEIGQAPGLAFFAVYFACKAYLQAHGKTRPLIVAGVVANLINLFSCSLLVRGDDALTAIGLPGVGLPRLGALGAGIAFSIACGVLAVMVLVPCFQLRPARTAEQVSMKLTLRLGLPMGMQGLAEVGVFTVGALLVGRFGAEAESAHQIALGLAGFTFMGAFGVSGATSVRVGYAVGQARSPRRAGLLGVGLGASFMALSGLTFACLPGPLVRMFTGDAETVALGKALLLIAAAFQLFDGVQVCAAGALRGAGDVRYPFLATVFAHWVVGFPLACLLGLLFGFGVRGIWWGLTSGLVCVAVLLARRFLRVSGQAIARV